MSTVDRSPQPPGLDMGAFKERFRASIDDQLAKLQGKHENRNLNLAEAGVIIRLARELIKNYNLQFETTEKQVGFRPQDEKNFIKIDSTIDGKNYLFELREDATGKLSLWVVPISDMLGDLKEFFTD